MVHMKRKVVHYPDVIEQPPPFLWNVQLFMSSNSSEEKQDDILCKYLRSPVFLGWKHQPKLLGRLKALKKNVYKLQNSHRLYNMNKHSMFYMNIESRNEVYLKILDI